MTTASAILLAVAMALHPVAVATGSPSERSPAPPSAQSISPYWPPLIQRWGTLIVTYAQEQGLDPDLVAAVIQVESAGYSLVTSPMGAVGLMQVMPFANRPPVSQLYQPEVNIRWGTLILADMLRQADGDLLKGLAAYIGGWNRAGNRMPRRQATFVLDAYLRAVAVRQGLPAESTEDWVLLVESQADGRTAHFYIVEPGYQPTSRKVKATALGNLWGDLHKATNAVVFAYQDEAGAGAITIWVIQPTLRSALGEV